ncbi:isochorismatase family cysteine hydrolase [Pseudosporangium ferrugineum]|uniref:Nicotinamidase-related amidase n=1 Tax=Pseudosporangium ferrugineum TaxID=439699 RepID=A0A2T0RKJ4_9ACTN|nr:isochorismatase family cysteine hydrolase [Pseudosporangium ferrugineum]PRY21640.1 nicotinamidase-related amidase [Pseudosporangium ferrugineum]
MTGSAVDAHLAPHWGAAALVTIDMQRDFLSESRYGLSGTTEIVPPLRDLIDAFRTASRPIIHIVRLYRGDDVDRVRRTLIGSGADMVRPGTPGRLLAPGLLPGDGPDLDDDLLLAGKPQPLGPHEYALFKPRWGAFYRTPLDDMLREREVDTVVFAGCNLPNCPRASIIEASERDYRVVLAADAVSQATGQGLREVAGLGVVLLDVAEIVAGLAVR